MPPGLGISDPTLKMISAIGLEAGSGVEHEQNDLVDVRRRAGPADDEYVTLGINPHIRRRIEALDTGLAVDMRPEQRAQWSHCVSQ